MSKKTVTFSIYCILIITVLVLFLVFFSINSASATEENNSQSSTQVSEDEQVGLPNIDDTDEDEPIIDDLPDDSTDEPNDPPIDSDETDDNDSTSDVEDETNDNQPSIDVDDETNSDPPTDIEDDITYATTLTLKCPRSITINLSESVSLIGDYILIRPADSVRYLTYTISGKYGSEPSGITFSDNIITAKEVGTYYIEFTVPKSNGHYLTDGIQVSVVDIENTNIVQVTTTLYIGSEYSLSEVFECNTKTDIKITVVDTNLLKYGNRTFTPISEGEARIEISLIYDYVKYNYCYSLAIEPKPLPPEYTIEIYDLDRDLIELTIDTYYFIQYNVIDKNGVTAQQKIKVTSSNAEIVEVISIDHPLILIKSEQKGEVILTLTCLSDESITKEVKIIVK